MDYDSLKGFKKKWIKLVCEIPGSDKPVFYTGQIQSLGESSLSLIDKFGLLVSLDYTVIRKVESVDSDK